MARVRALLCVVAVVASVVGGTLSSAAHQAAGGLPDATVRARQHFFGAENVDARGRLPTDRVILSWFSVASFAMAIDGKVVLLDTYIHKGEDAPNYVPTTTAELVELRPSVIFVGHGHFDHANTAGEVAARTGALIVGTPEHCDQASEQAGARLRCLAGVKRGSAPGTLTKEIRPLGGRVAITVLKHVHSAYEMPDGEGHESIPMGGPDPNTALVHPPGPSMLPGLNPAGDENGTILYQFRIGRFSLTWHDSVGPLRERAPELLKVLSSLPPTDVEVGATIGFNSMSNGMRDPVDYVAALEPKIFYPNHHDFVLEYGMSHHSEATFRSEMTRQPDLRTEVRWLYDPYDYLRPQLMNFDINAARFAR